MLNNPFSKTSILKAITLVSTTSLLSACFHEDEDLCSPSASDHYAVISTQAADGSSGDVSIISLDNFCADNKNSSSLSDSVISTDSENFYHIGRFLQDNITKFNINSPSTLEWQYSANADGEEKSNPYKLVVKNDTTAYLIRYGQPTIWIVDPSATEESAFKTGEIDLSTYAGDDLIPEASDALLIDDKLHVLMQNLDRNDGWTPGVAYIAIFDTANENIEIETNSDENTPNGITLTTVNPSTMEYLSSNNTIYVSSIGEYAKSYTTPITPAVYSGGIESIDLSDYSTNLVVDDGDETDAPYGQTVNVAILNSTQGYFIGYNAFQDANIFSFNPTSGDVDETPLLVNKDISDIEIGPMGNLWISNRSESGITIFDTVTNTVSHELIDTDLLPNDIEFLSKDTEN